MRRVYWDTMVYAYWFENHPKFGPRIHEIYDVMSRRGDTLCTSPFVLGELLVGPLKLQDQTAVDLIEEFFRSDLVSLLPYPPQAAKTFARLRADQNIKSLDALHLAVASSAGVDLFLTNDRRLHKLIVPGISFITTLETDLF